MVCGGVSFLRRRRSAQEAMFMCNIVFAVIFFGSGWVHEFFS